MCEIVKNSRKKNQKVAKGVTIRKNLLITIKSAYRGTLLHIYKISRVVHETLCKSRNEVPVCDRLSFLIYS